MVIAVKDLVAHEGFVDACLGCLTLEHARGALGWCQDGVKISLRRAHCKYTNRRQINVWSAHEVRKAYFAVEVNNNNNNNNNNNKMSIIQADQFCSG